MSEVNKTMPVLFIGHGSPENAYLDNEFTRRMKLLGKELPRPKAILCVSAHWLTQGSYVTAMENPRTIHDFYGFPDKLYKITYPAPGNPDLAKRVRDIVKKTDVGLDKEEWGLDHGTWMILKLMYPEADIPVVQFSIDYYKPPEYHYELGKELSCLRDEGILVIGSGNLVHNIRQAAFPDLDAKPYDWAVEFDSKVEECLNKGDHESLINYRNWGRVSRLAHPTPDHYYPLMYTIALQRPNDSLTYPYIGFHYASASMRAVKIG